MTDSRGDDGRQDEQDDRYEDGGSTKPADDRDHFDKMCRDEGAGDDRDPGLSRARQVRRDPADDDPAGNEEQPRPGKRDRQERDRPDQTEGDRQPEDQRDDLRRG